VVGCSAELYGTGLTDVILEPVSARGSLVWNVIVAWRDQWSRLIDLDDHDRSNPARSVKHPALGEKLNVPIEIRPDSNTRAVPLNR
jgi:hypothetical protein